MRLRSIPRTLVVLATAACASTAGGPATDLATDPAADPAPIRTAYRAPNRSVLTGDEVRAARVANALDAIERLRPEFLRARAVGSRTPLAQRRPAVFHNGVYLGTLDVLRGFSPSEIVSVRRISASEATVRYGTRYGGVEALEIVTSATGH